MLNFHFPLFVAASLQVKSRVSLSNGLRVIWQGKMLAGILVIYNNYENLLKLTKIKENYVSLIVKRTFLPLNFERDFLKNSWGNFYSCFALVKITARTHFLKTKSLSKFREENCPFSQFGINSYSELFSHPTNYSWLITIWMAIDVSFPQKLS